MCWTWCRAARCCAGWRRRACGRCCSTGAGPARWSARFTLTDYIAGRLERGASAAVGGPVVLAGYCMGGLLALAAALRRPDLVRGAGAAGDALGFPRRAAASASRGWPRSLPLLEPLLAPPARCRSMRCRRCSPLLDPAGIADKYRGFARLDPASAARRSFVALEDWLNDGVPLAAPVARECLAGWYGANTPARGDWRDRRRCRSIPAALACPAFVAVPARDRIVPPDSAAPARRR